MIFSLFSRRLSLPIGDRVLQWRTPDGFDSALGGKLSISPVALTILGALPDDALQREEESLRSQERRINEALADAVAPGCELDVLFEEMDASKITEDHDWRAILAGLKDAGPSCRAYRRTALGRYGEYVASAGELIRTLLASRRDAPARNGDGEDLGPRQTLAFDLASLSLSRGALRHGALEEFYRLPKGDPVTVALTPGQSVTIRLANHLFTLVAGDPCVLVDENGNDVRLAEGRNVVGRSLRSDVALDGVFRAVSRRHLIVEVDRARGVTLTDISTLGTFLPRPDTDLRLH